MSIYRTIHVSMWGDAKFRDLPDDAKLLWIYLLTGPETTSAPGCIAIGRASLAESLDWEVDRLDAAFAHLSERGMAQADWRARFVWLPNSTKYLIPIGSKHVVGWLPYLQVIPECDLKDKAIGAIWKYLQTRSEEAQAVLKNALGKPYLDRCKAALDTLSDTLSDRVFPSSDPHPDIQEQEQEQEQDLETLSESAAAEPDPEPAIRPAELQALWNKSAHPDLPRWRDLTKKRQALARARLRERSIDGPGGWREVVARISASSFCRGANDRAWVASPDWLLQPDTATKVLEGKYDNRAPTKPSAPNPYRVVND